MLNAELNFGQLPPFSTSLRFFVTAPVFLIIGIVIFFIFQINFIDRWETNTIALLHFFNLGFLIMIIMGAMIQMLPVLAGTTTPSVLWFSRLTHFLLMMGALLFPTGLLIQNQTMILFGVIFVLSSVIIFFFTIIWSLRGLNRNFSISCFRLSAYSALIMSALASRLAFSWAGVINFPINRLEIVELHIAWALFGFIYILILGASNKVVPMFYVTPEYSSWFTRYISKVTFLILVIWTFALFLASGLSWSILPIMVAIFKSLLSISVLIFSVQTYVKFSMRRRKITDSTILFWKTSMIFFAFASLGYTVIQFWEIEKLEIISTLLYGSALIFLITGMLYKIVPFLTWLHLTSKNLKKTPSTRELLPDRFCKRQYYILLLSVLLLFLFVFEFIYVLPLAICFGLSVLFLLLNLMHPLNSYLKLTKLKFKE